MSAKRRPGGGRPTGTAQRRQAGPRAPAGAGDGATGTGSAGRSRAPGSPRPGRAAASSEAPVATAAASRPGNGAARDAGAGGRSAGGAAVRDRRARGSVPSRSDEAPAGPPAWVPWLAFGLCVLALADSAYLTYTHFNPGALVCSSTGIINCAKVTTSPESYAFGIPVAILGLAFYAGMTVLHTPWAWRDGGVRVARLHVPALVLARLRLAGVVVGIGMVVYLLIAELFLIKNICEYCTGVHILTFLLFVTVVTSYPALSYRARWLAWAGDAPGGAGD